MAALRGDAQESTASNIENMLGELRSMSREMDAQFLAYLIEMAMVEANQLSATSNSNVIAIAGNPSAEDLAHMYMSGDLD